MRYLLLSIFRGIPIAMFAVTALFLSGAALLGSSGFSLMSAIGMYGIVATIIGWVVAVVLGVPLFLLARRLGAIGWQYFIFGGFLCGAAFWAVWFYPYTGGHFEAYWHTNGLYFCASGVFSGLSIWHCYAKAI
ncbi:hypothetical protein [Halopseudomonas salegens]|nr:hypothetical protein [Halopseudomonas salegens]